MQKNLSGGQWKTERQYAWNARGGMSEARKYDPATSALLKKISFSYDDSGERILRAVEGGETTAYFNALGETVAELDASRLNVRRHFVRGGGKLLADRPEGAAPRFFHADHLRSIRLLTNASGGAIDCLGYKPFGEPLDAAAQGSLTNYSFTGQWRDADLELQHHGARWYDPALGSWLSADPMFDFPGNFGNAYAYAGLSPLSQYDPTGTFSMVECVATLASRAWASYNFMSDAKDILQLTVAIATGGSVSAVQVAFVMASLLPGVPNMSKAKKLEVGKDFMPLSDDLVELMRRSGTDFSSVGRLGTNAKGQIGEGIMGTIGSHRFKERVVLSNGSKRVHGYDNLFKDEAGDFVIAEAKAGKNFVGAAVDRTYKARNGDWIKKFANDDPQLKAIMKSPAANYVVNGSKEQGTIGWIVDYAVELKRTGTAADRQTAEGILDSVLKGKIKWYEVRTQLDDADNIEAVEEILLSFEQLLEKSMKRCK